MLDPNVRGVRSEAATHDIEKGAIRRFAEAIGDHNPLYHDEVQARARGFRSLVAPPTFAFTLRPGSDVRASLAIDWRDVLHGEQRFSYARPLVAGDRVTVQAEIVDVYAKSGRSGAMDFIVTETTGSDENGATIYRMRTVTVIRRRN